MDYIVENSLLHQLYVELDYVDYINAYLKLFSTERIYLAVISAKYLHYKSRN